MLNHAPLDHLLVEFLLLHRGEVTGHLVQAVSEQLQDSEQLLPECQVLHKVHDLVHVLPQKVGQVTRVNLDHGHRDRMEIIRT